MVTNAKREVPFLPPKEPGCCFNALLKYSFAAMMIFFLKKKINETRDAYTLVSQPFGLNSILLCSKLVIKHNYT